MRPAYFQLFQWRKLASMVLNMWAQFAFVAHCEFFANRIFTHACKAGRKWSNMVPTKPPPPHISWYIMVYVHMFAVSN